jgi:hypothetical protein
MKFDLTEGAPSKGFDLTSIQGVPPQYRDNVLKQKAMKYNLALGGDSPGVDVLESQISNGEEAGLRQNTSVQQSMKYRREKLALLQEFTANNPDLQPPDLEMTMAVMNAEPNVNPETILEKLYAERYVDMNVADNEVVEAGVAEDADATYSSMTATEDIVARQEIVKRQIEDLELEIQQSSLGTKVWNTLETFVPLSSTIHMMDNKGSLIPSENIDRQADELWSLPLEEFAPAFKARFDEIKASNPYDAYDFATRVLGYSASQAFLDNSIGVIDIGGIVTGQVAKMGFKALARAGKGASKGKAAAKEGKTLQEKVKDSLAEPIGPPEFVGPPTKKNAAKVKKAFQSMAKANASKDSSVVDILAATGKVEEAATIAAVKAVKNRQTPLPLHQEVLNLSSKVPSLWNPGVFLNRAGRYTTEQVRRIEEYLSKSGDSLLDALQNPSMAMRLTEEALVTAVSKTKDKLRRLYPSVNAAIVDTKWQVTLQDDVDNLARTNEVTMTLGTPEALPFDSEDTARVTAELLYGISDQDYKVLQEGKGFYLTITRPVDETDETVRALATKTSFNQTPGGMWNVFAGFLRSPEDTVSTFQRENRHAATHAQQEMQAYFKFAADGIGKLSKKQRKRMNELMAANRDHVEGSQRGRFWDSLEEYATAYERMFHEYPSAAEAAAYFTTRQLNDVDWMLRNLSIYRDKSRMGVVNVDLSINKDGVTVPIKTEGILRDDLPWDRVESADVYIPNENNYFITSNVRKDEAFRTHIKELLNSGYRVIEIHNPNSRPLMDATGIDDTVNFIIVNDAKTSKLSWNQVPYKPGYHVEYAPGYFVKQPMLIFTKTGRRRYVGDTSILHFTTEEQAKKYAERMETFRQLFKDKKFVEAKDFASTNLPHSWKQLTTMFNSSINQNVPITYTKSGRNIADDPEMYSRYIQKAENTLDDPFNTYAQLNKKYTSEKDLPLPSATDGTESHPLIDLKQANYIDPLTTMFRATTSLIRNRAYDDYQIGAVESWMSEFKDVLEGSAERAYRNPTSVVYNPRYDRAANRERVSMAENSRKALVGLLGQRSELDSKIDWAFNKVLDSVYRNFGEAKADKIAAKTIGKLEDPARYLRAVAFHSKMGLFNPIQLFLQSQTIFHAAAITGNPARAASATAGAWMMRGLGMTDNFSVIEGMAQRATKLGWSKDEFLESYLEMKRTGWWRVEGENAWKDDAITPKLFTTKWGKFLDKGLVFFREGERMTRLSAWNMAFKEWKKANPGKAIDTRARNSILRRADDMAVNMTRASMASWQKGILSVRAQFNGYTIRLMEQMLGSRLTKAEKARVLGMYSTLYGLPVGLTTVVPFHNWGEDIKQHGLENGVDINDGMTEVLLNGIIAASVEGLFGPELNLAERYGPGQLPLLNSIARGDESIAEIVLGPSGGILMEIIKGMDPVLHDINLVFSGDQEALPILAEDLMNVGRNVSTMNSVSKAYFALNLGNYYSKNEILLARDVDGVEAFFMGVFGLDPRELNDAFLMKKSIDNFKDVQVTSRKEFTKNMRRAYTSKDAESRERYLKMAKTWFVGGGFRPDQIGAMLSQTFDNDSTVERMREMWVRLGPVGTQWKRREELLRQDIKKKEK